MGIRKEKGFTLPELAVVMGIMSLVVGGLITQYTASVSSARDHSIRIETQVHAQALLQTLSSELRVLGNGVPFDQDKFQIGESTLLDPSVTYPIDVATSTADTISFRLNEVGEVAVLTQDFNPAITNTIEVHDVGEMAVGDPVYISDAVMSGDNGFYGVIDAVAANTIDVTSMDYNPGATFDKGSTLEVVPMITYANALDGTVTRDSGFGPVVMARRATLGIEYLDFNGNVMALPLTQASILNRLRSVRITITMTSAKNLKNGGPHTATVDQVVGLRNLNFLY